MHKNNSKVLLDIIIKEFVILHSKFWDSYRSNFKFFIGFIKFWISNIPIFNMFVRCENMFFEFRFHRAKSSTFFTIFTVSTYFHSVNFNNCISAK